MARNKYGAKKTEVDGIVFDSKAEARRWGELKLLARAGEIFELNRQVPYSLMVNGAKVGVYRADFVYVDRGENVVIEDCKGFKTPEYKLKAKIMAAMGHPITEVAA